ncbi:MAG: CO dehydrogenase/acetyl-CoA synthase complex subunit epsilon [Methermicoccaceae archaeon]
MAQQTKPKKLDTTRRAVPFDKGDTGSVKPAKAMLPQVMAKTISKAGRPLLVVGSNLTEPQYDIVARFAPKMAGVAATGRSLKPLLERGVDATYVNLYALEGYIADSRWQGFDYKGGYDTCVFVGHLYYYASHIIRGLVNFTDVKVVSIDRYYYPAAHMTFGNLSDEDFERALEAVLEAME